MKPTLAAAMEFHLCKNNQRYPSRGFHECSHSYSPNTKLGVIKLLVAISNLSRSFKLIVGFSKLTYFDFWRSWPCENWPWAIYAGKHIAAEEFQFRIRSRPEFKSLGFHVTSQRKPVILESDQFYKCDFVPFRNPSKREWKWYFSESPNANWESRK